jgi:hypothetical protein
MDEIKAPEQNLALARIADLLRKAEQESNPEFLPRSLNVMGLFADLFLPSARTVEKMSYGDPLFRMPQQSRIPITTDKEYVADVLGMAPAVPAASRAISSGENYVGDALTQAITKNPDATSMRVLEETRLPLANIIGQTPQEGVAVNRLNMNFKDVTKRVPELTEAAKKVRSGEMSVQEYNELVNTYKPVEPYTFVPKPATFEEATQALTSNKKEMFGKTDQIPAGEITKLRLDIPAYKDHGVWVNSIHRDKTKNPTVYAAVSSVKNARMIGAPEKAIKVASGESAKSPFAVIQGEWNPISEEQAVSLAQKHLNDPDWKQVGYDPERHGYFYDRETMVPIVSSEEVIQIGPLVLAKNPKYGKKFETEDGAPLYSMIGAGGAGLLGLNAYEDILSNPLMEDTTK